MQRFVINKKINLNKVNQIKKKKKSNEMLRVLARPLSPNLLGLLMCSRSRSSAWQRPQLFSTAPCLLQRVTKLCTALRILLKIVYLFPGHGDVGL